MVFPPPNSSDKRKRLRSDVIGDHVMKFHLLRVHVTIFLFVLGLLTGFFVWQVTWNVFPQAYAQAPSAITSSGLNTQVSAPAMLPNGKINYNITGGTRPADGANLFHSFGEFGVPANNIANFLNDSGLATSNILGRVTGANPSNIFGMIQTTGFGSANLFLMNPAGIVFGPNATLNVGGSVNFTTANYLRLSDGARFHTTSGAQDVALSSAPVAAFGFLGSKPESISAQGSQLTVREGQSLSLIGGDIQILRSTSQPARISAPGGQINVVSVASVGEVLASNFQPAPTMTLGSITMSQGSVLDVSGNAGGTVRIRGGEFVMDNGTISADTSDINGASIAVDIQLTADLSISTDLSPTITARTTGSGDAGEIQIASENVQVTAASEDIMSIIDSHSSGSGKGGNVSITTGDLTVAGDPLGTTTFIDSGVVGTEGGHGGNVAITSTGRIEMQDSPIITGHQQALQLGEDSIGTAGSITITADSLHLSLSPISSNLFSFAPRGGTGGNIAITARQITSDASFINAFGFEQGGAVTINAGRLIASDTEVSTGASLGSTGGVTITANVVEMTDGSTVVSSTGGDIDAAPIFITATDHITFSRPSGGDRPSGVFSNSFGTFGTLGKAGDIIITAPRLELTGGARINTTTRSTGDGGNVIINAADSVSISGEIRGLAPEPLFSLGALQPSGIFTLTIGGRCTGPCGDAGHISATTGSLNLGSGGQIDSGTRSTGRGGDITVNVRDTTTISGTLSNGQPAGMLSRTIGTDLDSLSNGQPAGMLSRTIGTDLDSGTGGNIALAAGQSVSLSNGASISASSTGPANPGNIAINAGAQFLSQNASVTTEATQASGGNILIQATDAIQLVNSRLNTSVQGGPTTAGGNITL
ncbi:MAG: uncharacterized protein K0S58_2929, partial [Nitrospira sp.]|nr:uncharacterized protein [Nitrospira sp.]